MQIDAKVILCLLVIKVQRKPKETWECLNCGHENDEDTDVCEGMRRHERHNILSSGAMLETDYGGDDLWDDDQGLM